MSKPLKDDIEELIFHITVTEYFIGEGMEHVSEKKMDLRTPIRNCLGALYTYAVDYCMHHNMHTDNYFVIRVYTPSRHKAFEKIVTGQLNPTEYQIIMHKDYRASFGDLRDVDFSKKVEVVDNKLPKILNNECTPAAVSSKKIRLAEYDKYIIGMDIDNGATIDYIMRTYNIGYAQAKIIFKERGKKPVDKYKKEDLKEYKELEKEMGKCDDDNDKE